MSRSVSAKSGRPTCIPCATSRSGLSRPTLSSLPSRGGVRQTSSKIVPPQGGAKGEIAGVQPRIPSSAGPSLLQKQVFTDALRKSVQNPYGKVKSVGAQRSRIAAPMRYTKRGQEPLLQEVALETTLQRTPAGEYIGRTVTGIDVDAEGRAQRVEVTMQQIDPNYATESKGVNATTSVTRTVSVTTGGKQTKKSLKKKTVKSDRLLAERNRNPQHINRLVEEETEDINNTLKMVAPNLASSSLDKFPLKQRLKNLRLTSDPVSTLQSTVVLPTPTADDAIDESGPEMMFSVMHAVEKGATPNSSPNQLFNSLFPEVKDQQIEIGSVAAGPLEDVVVPIHRADQMTEEILSSQMETAVLEVQINQVLPHDDIAMEQHIHPLDRTPTGDESIPMILDQEIPPWENSDIQKMSVLVGGNPIDLLDASDISIKETSTDMVEELSKGIDYFIDANPKPYVTKVQVRGSKPPPWFPGYMSAFPYLPEIVQITKSPSMVLHSAWRAVQPKFFPLDAIVYNDR